MKKTTRKSWFSLQTVKYQIFENLFASIFDLKYISVIQGLGEIMKVRQQVVATATVFFKRFYAKNSIKSIDPLLMCPTALYLAAKVDVGPYNFS